MVELIASQAAFTQDYIRVANSLWENSRHPENFKDVAESINNENISRRHKLGAFACLVPMAWALGPGNEATLGYVAGKTLEGAGGKMIPSVIAVSATTASMELMAGLGTSNILNKFSGATDVLRSRYVTKSSDNNIEKPASGKLRKLARTFGIVALTGTGSTGASLDHSLRDSDIEGRHNRTKRTAVVAAGMLAVINAGYSSAILGISKSVESVGMDNASDSIAGAISNPLLVGGIIGGAFAIKSQYDLYGRRGNKVNIPLQQIEVNLHESVTGGLSE